MQHISIHTGHPAEEVLMKYTLGRRKYERHDTQGTIRYSDWASDDLFQATMNNICDRGCSFNINDAVQPGIDLFLIPDGYPIKPETGSPEDGGVFARVVWCRKTLDDKDAGYRVGVEYTPKFWEKSYDPGVGHLDPAKFEVTYTDLIRPAFEMFADDPACYYMGTRVTYQMLDQYSNQFAHMLGANGLEKGDVVGIHLPNIPEYLIAALGTLKAGCIVSGVSPLLSDRELAYQLRDADARALVTLDAFFSSRVMPVSMNLPDLKVIVAASVGGFLPMIKQKFGKLFGKIPKGRVTPISGKTVLYFSRIIRSKKYSKDLPETGIDPGDAAFLMYTGGTTGTPKGVMITHKNIVSNILLFQAWADLNKENTVTMSGFPFFHAAGMFFAVICMNFGYTQVLIPDPRNIKHICREMAVHNPRALCNVPSLYQLMMNDADFKSLDHSNLEYCWSGASPFPKDSQAQLEKVVGKNKLVEVYGLTESSSLLILHPIQNLKKPGTIGLPLPNTDIKLKDPETGMEVPVGQPGEICAKGPQIMKGYYKKPDENKKVFDSDGYLHTGDIGIFDTDGYLTLVDRVKDMIIVSGYKVFSKKVEEILSEHPAVNMIALVGVPNPDRPGSEIVKAFITVSPGFKGKMTTDILKEEILKYAKVLLTPYEVPKIIEFLEEMPLTAVGKINKKALRKNLSFRASTRNLPA